MDAYDRCNNLEKKILPILLPSMVEAENFSDHPRKIVRGLQSWKICKYLQYRINHLSEKCISRQPPQLWVTFDVAAASLVRSLPIVQR